MFKLKHAHRAYVPNKILTASLLIFILLNTFGSVPQVFAEENTDARLREIDSKLKEIESSQNQIMTDQDAMIEKIKKLKIWARHRGSGVAPA